MLTCHARRLSRTMMHTATAMSGERSVGSDRFRAAPRSPQRRPTPLVLAPRDSFFFAGGPVPAQSSAPLLAPPPSLFATAPLAVNATPLPAAAVLCRSPLFDNDAPPLRPAPLGALNAAAARLLEGARLASPAMAVRRPAIAASPHNASAAATRRASLADAQQTPSRGGRSAHPPRLFTAERAALWAEREKERAAVAAELQTTEELAAAAELRSRAVSPKLLATPSSSVHIVNQRALEEDDDTDEMIELISTENGFARSGGVYSQSCLPCTCLFDFSSRAFNEVSLSAGSGVLVTDWSSNDWWCGVPQDGRDRGRLGWFPSSYVAPDNPGALSLPAAPPPEPVASMEFQAHPLEYEEVPPTTAPAMLARAEKSGAALGLSELALPASADAGAVARRHSSRGAPTLQTSARAMSRERMRAAQVASANYSLRFSQFSLGSPTKNDARFPSLLPKAASPPSPAGRSIQRPQRSAERHAERAERPSRVSVRNQYFSDSEDEDAEYAATRDRRRRSSSSSSEESSVAALAHALSSVFNITDSGPERSSRLRMPPFSKQTQVYTFDSTSDEESVVGGGCRPTADKTDKDAPNDFPSSEFDHEGLDGVCTPNLEDVVITPPHDHIDDGVATPPYENDGIATPPHENDGIATPPHENDGIATPPHEIEGIATPPHEIDGIATPPHENDGGIATPPHENDGIATPPHENNGVSPLMMAPPTARGLIATTTRLVSHRHHTVDDGTATPPHDDDGITTPPHEVAGIITPPHEHDSIATPPHEHDDIATPPHELDGVVTSPHEHDGNATPPREHVVIATPPSLNEVRPPSPLINDVIEMLRTRYGGIATPPHDGVATPPHEGVSPDNMTAAQRFAAMVDGDNSVRALTAPPSARLGVGGAFVSIADTTASEGVRRKTVSLSSAELWQYCARRVGAMAFALGLCRSAGRRRRAVRVFGGSLALAFSRSVLASRRALRVAIVGLLVRSAKAIAARRAWAPVFMHAFALAMRRARLTDRIAPKALSLGHSLGGIRVRRNERLAKLKASALAVRAVAAFQGGARTKGLHWEVLSGEAVEGTIWERGEGTAPELSSSLLGGLLEKFTEGPKTTKASAALGESSASAAPPKPARAGPRAVLEPDVSRNLAISVASVIGKYDVDQVIDAIRALDVERVGGREKVALLAASPILFDSEKMAPLKSYAGADSRAALVPHERFAAALFFELPGARLRLAAMDLTASLPEIRSAALARCSLLSAASKELCTSRRFATLLLDVILPLGNRLNANKGPALGFKISSLSKLVQTRSSSGESFLQFIIEGLATREPDLLRVVDDFANLQRANSGAAISRELVASDLSRLVVGVKQANALVALTTKAGETSTARATDFAAAVSDAANQVAAAEKEANKAYSAAARWLGEDPKTVSPETLFGFVQSFFAALTRDIKARHDRIAREATSKRTTPSPSATAPPARRAILSRRVTSAMGGEAASSVTSRPSISPGALPGAKSPPSTAQKRIEDAVKANLASTLNADVSSIATTSARARPDTSNAAHARVTVLGELRASSPRLLSDELMKAQSPRSPPRADASQVVLQRLSKRALVMSAPASSTSPPLARSSTTTISNTRSSEGGPATSPVFPPAARPASKSSPNRGFAGGSGGNGASSGRKSVRMDPNTFARDAVSAAIEESMRKRQSARFQSFAELEAVSGRALPDEDAAVSEIMPPSPLKSPLTGGLWSLFGYRKK